MKILVVDDSRAMRMIVVRTLRQAGFGEHAVSEAANGSEALALLHQELFDFVISGWNMPVMNGIDLLHAMRGEKMPVRFGFVTSEATGPMREQAASAGAEFLVAKPVTVETLQTALRGVLAL